MDPNLQEDLAKRNAELKTLLAAQERELEIEAALERVRSVAMGMKEPADMLEVCRTIAHQLKALHVQEIRNVQTAIFYEDKGTYMNYEYYAKHDKTFITETSFTNHTMHQAFAAQMLKGKGEFFTNYMSKDELPSWIAYQKTTNVFIDTFLETASSLSYYWHSLGPVALGISTYEPLSEEDKALFKRFLNVFELSYTRYLDIERAIGQAREAQIQLALERVRARTMAMQKSDELSEAVYVLFQQFKDLGENPDQATIGVINEDEKVIEYWVTMYGSQINKAFKFSIDEPNVTYKIYKAWKQNKKSLVIDLSGNALTEFMAYRASKGGAAVKPEEKRRIINVAFFSKGLLNVQSNKERPEESLKLLERFASVFEQTYTRFLDLQKVEAQVRESQIQLALERVRARTMAMQKSDELSETAYILFQQFKQLGDIPLQITIGIFNEEKEVIEFRITGFDGSGSKVDQAYEMNMHEPVLLDKLYAAWKEQKKSVVVKLTGKEMRGWVDYRNKISGRTEPASTLSDDELRFVGVGFFSKGLISFSKPEPIESDTINVLERFASVFDQTYIRFLDLQKAETQARESQIQLALERVRARTMAMQKSDELAEAAVLLFQQVRSLGIELYASGFTIWENDGKDLISWMCNADGSVNPPFKMPIIEIEWHQQQYESWKSRKQYAIHDFTGKEMQDYYRYLRSFPLLDEAFKKSEAAGIATPDRQVHNVFNFSYGNLLFITLQTVSAHYDIFKRFAKVFEQTYTRFLDLQNAEAQAREAQIEAALERVRSRSMAMHQSIDLHEVVKTVMEQLSGLGIKFNVASFASIHSSGGWDLWISAPDQAYPAVVEVPYIDHGLFNNIVEAIRNGRDFVADVYDRDEKNIFFKHFFENTAAKYIPDARKEWVMNCKGFARSVFLTKNIWLAVSNYDGIPFNNQENAIFKRFANAFEQTYIRFLDLQKAEAQAREAEIELALERVRAKTMAMKKHNDLTGVINLLAEQLLHLGFDLQVANFSNGINNKDWDLWIYAVFGDLKISTRVLFPWFDHPFFNRAKQAIDAYNAGGADISIEVFNKQDKDSWLDYAFSKTTFSELPDELRKYQYESPGYSWSSVILKETWVAIGKYDTKPFSKEENNILRKFANAFGQAYTRFLDLQKAEAQAREGQIQLALERVRARTMAMHKSEELAETTQVLSNQLMELGVIPDRMAIGVIDETAGLANFWLTDQAGSNIDTSFKARLDEPTVMAKIYKAWKDHERSLVIDLYGDDLKKWIQFVREEMRLVVKDEFINDRRVHSLAFFSQGWVLVTTHEPQPEETIQILERFASVFNLTYTRFLDLQKAEAQARESQIQLALERVRARTMAMQRSGELYEVAHVVFEQMNNLSFDSFMCSVNLYDKATRSFECISSSGMQSLLPQGSYHIPYLDHPFHKLFVESQEEGLPYKVFELSGETKKTYDQLYFTLTDWKNLPETSKQMMIEIESCIMSCAYMSYGSFTAIGDKPLSNENAIILQRFARVFEQTYTRFLDLQKAEAQAREAQIEAALERVRSRAMAMHKSEELKEVANELRKQLGLLGQKELETSAIHLYDESPDYFESWAALLSPNAEGEVIQTRSEFPKRGVKIIEEMLESYNQHKQDYVLVNEGAKALEFLEMLRQNAPEVLEVVSASMKGVATEDIKAYWSVADFAGGALVMTTMIEPGENSRVLLRRFANVFGLAYRRFTDLKKAEAQAREAEIELALERVRAKTMAMQHHSDMLSVTTLLAQQLMHLGFDIDQANFSNNGLSETDWDLWICSASMSPAMETFRLFVPWIDHPYFQKSKIGLENYKQRGIDLNVGVFTKAEKDSFMDHIFANTAYRETPSAVREAIYSTPGYTFSAVFLKETWLSIGKYEPKPFTDEQHAILRRLANAFGQAYTRFLDLQKAEAQAREAQIEAALERVRSRSISMQKSEELREVIQLVFEQLRQLNFNIDSAHFNLNYKESDDYNLWSAAPGQPYPVKTYIPCFDHPVFVKAREAKEKGLDFFTESYTQEEKNRFFEHLFKHIPAVSAERRKYILSGKGVAASTVLMNTISLWVMNYAGIPYSEAENAILKRFGKVFEQSHTRFLDLKKAEAQAREAQIETALERVRASTMAMHKSEELAQTAAVLFEQLGELGNTPDRISIGIIHEAAGVADMWLTDQSGNEIDSRFVLELSEKTTVQKLLAGWKAGVKSMAVDLIGDELNTWLDYVRKIGLVVKDEHFKNRRVHNIAFFSHGWLNISTLEPLPPEMMKILERFATVYSLTYRRFLDLQQAEAQAREAKIEAALEKIRSRTMAMQKSDELNDVATLLFQQVKDLGIKTWTAGFNVWSDDSNTYTDYITSPQGDVIQSYTIDATRFSVFTDVSDARKRGEKFWIQYLEGEQLKEAYKQLSSFGSEKQYEKMLEDGYEFPSHQYDHFVFGSKVSLMFITYEAVPESHDIFIRFGNVFEQTYTRFLDLQKAEASAREAVKQAALDRIRADIASMRTVSDLDRITPLIWSELNILGIPFIRCGVFLMDDVQQLIHTFLSGPDGKAIAAFHMPYDAPGNLGKVLSHWQQKKKYIDHWSENDFMILVDVLVKQGSIANREEYMASLPRGGLHLHFLPFLQGMLYVGNTARLGEEEIKLLQSVADAFSTAYARYEDFNKLEAAKKQVDSTLNELQATQKQLIQSEKMASLGELTAGIAHEIQNPLNFVNNFSEVNNELISELVEEFDKGNYDEVKVIAASIKDNEEKINNHGKRADAIVKGMLQHSKTSTGQKEPTDINILCDEYLRLSYHGLRAKDKSFNATMKTNFDESIEKIDVVPQDIGRMLLNVFNNAFYTVNAKLKAQGAQLAARSNSYVPTVSVVTKKLNDKIEIRVEDNGKGIPQNIVDKIFQPFFTTKPTGQGTGLGLSLAYDIIKAHDGEIKVEAKEGEGSKFIVQLPYNP